MPSTAWNLYTPYPYVKKSPAAAGWTRELAVSAAASAAPSASTFQADSAPRAMTIVPTAEGDCATVSAGRERSSAKAAEVKRADVESGSSAGENR